MRNKFTELIEQGVAKFDYVPVAPQIPEQDPICRQYNNIWSIPSDTHMHYNAETGERYITGHMIGIQDKWTKFVCSCNWGGMTFRTTGYWSLCDFLNKHGLCGQESIVNGETIYLVTPVSHGEEISCKCPLCCTTTESKMPLPIAQLTVNGDVMRIKECYHGKKNLYEVAQALNENIYVKGNDWAVNENNVMCAIGNKVFIL